MLGTLDDTDTDGAIEAPAPLCRIFFFFFFLDLTMMPPATRFGAGDGRAVVGSSFFLQFMLQYNGFCSEVNVNCNCKSFCGALLAALDFGRLVWVFGFDL